MHRVDGLHGLGARRANEARFEAGERRQLDRRRDRRALLLEGRHAVLLEALRRHLAVLTRLHVACAPRPRPCGAIGDSGLRPGAQITASRLYLMLIFNVKQNSVGISPHSTTPTVPDTDILADILARIVACRCRCRFRGMRAYKPLRSKLG